MTSTSTDFIACNKVEFTKVTIHYSLKSKMIKITKIHLHQPYFKHVNI